MVGAFGSTSIRAAVKTMPSRCAASASARTISRAAAASASWRSSRGVVPAWSARPASSTCSRSRAASRVTSPAGANEVATSRVWSTCSSRKPRSLSSHSGARRSPSGSTPALGHRVAERDAVVVDAVERVVDVELPDQRAGAERRRVEARALLVGERDHRDRARARRPRTRRRRRGRRRTARRTRTLSRCEPAAHHGPGVSGTAHRLPAGSRSIVRPIACARRANHAAASSSSRVHASRVVPPSSSRPIGIRSDSSSSRCVGGDHSTNSPPAIRLRTGLRPKR